MINNYTFDLKNFYEQTILAYINSVYQNPFHFVMAILDIAIVIFLEHPSKISANGDCSHEIKKACSVEEKI